MFDHTGLLYLHFGANQVPSADSGRFCREKLRRGGDFSAVQALWMGLTIDGAHSIISPVHALVAQLDRASDSDSEGRTFESCRAHQEKSLDFIEEIEAFFLCVDNRFPAFGDCFGDYTSSNPRFPGAPPPLTARRWQAIVQPPGRSPAAIHAAGQAPVGRPRRGCPCTPPGGATCPRSRPAAT